MKLNPSPKPPSPDSKSILDQLRYWHRKARAQDPKNWIFVYSTQISEDQTAVVSEDANLDGKRHVFLNPKHESAIAEFLASVPANDD